MTELIRHVLKSIVVGFCLATVFVAMLLWFNIANLWNLISSSEKGILVLLGLWVANGLVFSGIQSGLAFRGMRDDDDDDDHSGGLRGRNLQHDRATIPVRVDPNPGQFWQKR